MSEASPRQTGTGQKGLGHKGLRPSAPRPSRTAWIVLGAGIALYFIAVVNRTALGVAGVEALDRFGITAGWLSVLSVAQIATYAALQLPAGALLDRWGPRPIMIGGALLMAAGTALLAVTASLPVAILARILIGAGDAPIFISACRLIPMWFPPRRVPVLVQVTGFVGQAGQLATAIPVAWVLRTQGWSAAFLALAGITVVLAGVAVVGVRTPAARPTRAALGATAVGDDAPGIGRTESPAEPLRQQVRAATRPAGTKLGFWTHFVSLFSANTMALLWGVPFFVTAQERSVAEASLLLTVVTLSKMAAGPLTGIYTARHPLRRSWLVLAGAGATLAAWIMILAPATPRPLWQLVLFMAIIGAGGPVSLIAMDYARTFSPEERLGTATGFVNVGGFVATIASILLVGVTLEVIAPPGTSTYTLDHYRVAFAMLLIPWVIGVAGVLWNRRLARVDMAAEGVHVPPLRVAWRRYRGR